MGLRDTIKLRGSVVWMANVSKRDGRKLLSFWQACCTDLAFGLVLRGRRRYDLKAYKTAA